MVPGDRFTLYINVVCYLALSWLVDLQQLLYYSINGASKPGDCSLFKREESPSSTGQGAG